MCTFECLSVCTCACRQLHGDKAVMNYTEREALLCGNQCNCQPLQKHECFLTEVAFLVIGIKMFGGQLEASAFRPTEG